MNLIKLVPLLFVAASVPLWTAQVTLHENNRPDRTGD